MIVLKYISLVIRACAYYFNYIFAVRFNDQQSLNLNLSQISIISVFINKVYYSLNC